MFIIFRKGERIGPVIDLEDHEAKHAKARRLRPGDEIHVADGISLRRKGVLMESGLQVSLDPAEPPEEAMERGVDLFTAIPEGKRWDWLLQKSVELGVTRIIPVFFERSTTDRIKTGDRENRIVMEAAIQSRRFVLPELLEPIPFEKIGEMAPFPSIGFLHPPPMVQTPFNPEGIGGVLVGPEGGLSDREVELLLSRGARPGYLGRPILRVETAAVAALSLIASTWRN